MKHMNLLRRTLFILLGAALLTASFTACAPKQEYDGLVIIQDDSVPLAAFATNVKTPSSPGTVTFQGGGATIDASNANEGYVTVKYSGGVSKIKVLISRSGGTEYKYDLTNNGQYAVFPLTSGNGTYSIQVFENVNGNQYSQALSAKVDVNLNNALSPFLYPSQYVNFNAGSTTVAKGAELARSASTDLDVVANVYSYVVSNITYDNQKAGSIAAGNMTGYLPQVDSILASGKGICFDYAAVMAAMLRSQGIPTRLEVGYAGSVYHAWISCYITDVGWVDNVIYFDGSSWKRMDPTFASSAGNSSAINEYIGNGSNYSTIYIY